MDCRGLATHLLEGRQQHNQHKLGRQWTEPDMEGVTQQVAFHGDQTGRPFNSSKLAGNVRDVKSITTINPYPVQPIQL